MLTGRGMLPIIMGAAKRDGNAHVRRSPAFGLAILGSVLAGALAATQSRINGELARELDDGYLAAAISFGSGLVVLLVVLPLWPPGRTGARRLLASVRSRQTPWWYLIAGVAGALVVLSQSLTTAVLGVALFTVALVCGQVVSGLIVDRLGIGRMAPAPVTSARLAGSILAFAAVAWTGFSGLRADIPLWTLVLPLIAGIGIGWQQAVIGQLRAVAGSAVSATLVHFAVGSCVLVVATVVHSNLVGWPATLPVEPYLYLGGCIGAIFIGLSSVVVRRTGVLLLGLGTIAGQLVASLGFDLLAPITGRGITYPILAGTALALLAVVLAAVPSKPIGRPVTPPSP
ncbi:MAG: hypothetical protein JWL94_413 [Microbacteriaceae bacterium]|jgi:transporter family-2 protein|nr:hypothetical protein [Microbacteriaceae bacterium]